MSTLSPQVADYRYRVGGSLEISAPTYVPRRADEVIYRALEAREFCYVLNARQMGKSSLLVRMYHRFTQAGHRCVTLNMTGIGSNDLTPMQWYKGVLASLWRGLNLMQAVDFQAWWQQHVDLPSPVMLRHFLEDVLLSACSEQQRLYVLVDEIDSILNLDFSVDDAMALIRFCDDQRAFDPRYRNLVFALFGVATPSDLIQDKQRTPFNIGRAIHLEGLQLQDTQPLWAGLQPHVPDAQTMVQAILAWTEGQPFLTQKICSMIAQGVGGQPPQPADSAPWVAALVRQHVIENWESQDDPEHLRTIRDRILANEQRASRLLSIYQRLLQGEMVTCDDGRDQSDLLLSGLVVKQSQGLQIKNKIYREVFNLAWVEAQLERLRPYSQALRAWVESQQQDDSRLLRGQALQDAQTWAKVQSLSALDYQFLAASEACDRHESQLRMEVAQAHEIAARLDQAQRNTQQQRRWLMGLSASLGVLILLGLTTYRQFQLATLSKIEAIATTADQLYALHQPLESLTQGLEAQRQLQAWPAQLVAQSHPHLQAQVETVLLQALYGTEQVQQLPGDGSIAFHPTQAIVATSQGESLRLMERDGRLIKLIRAHSGKIRALAFSPEGGAIATASEDGSAKLWTLAGELIATLAGEDAGPVNQVAFSPMGQYVVTAHANGWLRLWDTRGRWVGRLRAHEGEILHLAFSPGGDWLASAGQDRTIALWHWPPQHPEKMPLSQRLSQPRAPITAIAFSPDGQFLMASSLAPQLQLWRRSVPADKAQAFVPWRTLVTDAEAIGAIAFSPDGQTVATATNRHDIQGWQLDSPFDGTRRSPLPQYLAAHRDRITDLKFSQGILASASQDGSVKFWQDNPIYRVQRSIPPVADFWLDSQDGHHRVVWQPQSTNSSATIDRRTGSFQTGSLQTGSLQTGSLQLWQRQNQQLRWQRTWQAHRYPITQVAISPDGQWIASASHDRTLKLWNFQGQLIHRLLGPADAVQGGLIQGLAFHPQGRILASVGLDGYLRLWRVDGQPIRQWLGDAQGLVAVTFSPDGKKLLTASRDRQVQIWTVQGQLLSTLPAQPQPVNAIALSPDGQWIAIASQDQTIQLWRQDGSWTATLKGRQGPLWQIGFSPDGQWLSADSQVGTREQWQLSLLQTPRQRWVYACQRLSLHLRQAEDVELRDWCSQLAPSHNP